MALKDLGEKGIVDPYPPLVDIKGELRGKPFGDDRENWCLIMTCRGRIIYIIHNIT